MGKYTFTGFVSSQLTATFQVPDRDLSGQVIIVTGSNVGLGYEAAKHLAGMKPAKLILACRDLVKAEAAAQEIKNTIDTPTSIEAWKLDLQNFQSVVQFVDKCNKELDRLDILVENAGIATETFRLTADKWESTLQTNVLSTFLMAILLLPLIRKTTQKNEHPRIVIVASGVHYWTPFVERQAPNIFERLNDESKFDAKDRYNVSKLLDVLLTKALSNHMRTKQDEKISVMSVCPGLCHSELARDVGGWHIWLLKKTLARTTEYGSRTFVHSAVGDIGEGRAKGSFWSDCKDTEPSDFVVSEEGAKIQEKLWGELLEILGGVDERVNTIVQ
ncbi:hypothetical protein AKO1_007078 [Acrasis kona]|uniref:NAD(P)-binding protein n=1 Tax=Acrasis kona TaxID=1008807 RepID=A0AAW2YSI8_9EUKA